MFKKPINPASCAKSYILASLLLLLLVSCFDFEEAGMGSATNLPPFIDKVHVSPSASEALRPINLGQNCRAKDFIVPPIKDPNHGDQLYYLWFIKRPNDLYGKLLQPGQGIIRTENRDSAVISLPLDRQTIESAFGEKLTDEFFTGSYLIEFFVADRQYLIPENRYIDSEAYEDYMHWTLTFVNNRCQGA